MEPQIRDAIDPFLLQELRGDATCTTVIPTGMGELGTNQKQQPFLDLAQIFFRMKKPKGGEVSTIFAMFQHHHHFYHFSG